MSQRLDRCKTIIIISFYIDMFAIDLKERIFLYYIAFNNLFIKNILIFLFDETTFCINTKDLAKKILMDYAFKKAKKAKKARGSGILDSKRWIITLKIFLKYEVEIMH